MPKRKFLGLKTHRFEDNPEERLFATLWADFTANGRPLEYLPDLSGRSPPPPCSDRDHEVAATVIQWLGSPVGQSFLQQAGWVKNKN